MPRVPTADGTENRLSHEVIGNKTDAGVQAVTTNKSLMGYVKACLDILAGTAGITTFPAAAAPANAVSLAEVIRMNHTLLLPVESAAGEADIDITAADYTGYIALLTIAPAASSPLVDCYIDLDLNLATTGWDTVSTASDTIDICAAVKIDGTNYRGIANATQVTAAGDGSLALNVSGVRLNIGTVGVTEDVVVYVKLSVERADAAIPYRVFYRAAAAPTITPVAAA